MEVKMHWAQKAFLVAAVVNFITSLFSGSYSEALWTALAFGWCLNSWGHEKESVRRGE